MKKDTNIENTLGVDSNFTSYDSDGNLNKGVEILPLDIIVPNPNQPRKSFDQTALEELAVSIKNYGIIQPIIVCPVGDGKYQIVAGERRYRASKIAGMNNIPVLKMILTAKQIKELSLIENLQRQDLNPIEEAKAFRSLIEEY